MPSSSSLSLLAALALAVLAPRLAAADCECGYRTTVGNTGSKVVFTDMVATDFAALSQIGDNTDWRRQEFNVTKAAARGPYGKFVSLSNVKANPRASGNYLASDGTAAGMQLIVRSKPVDGLIPSAEIDTSRVDMLYGSYRAAFELPDVPGTCAAFFWYFNDTQEIDLEFLTRDFDRDAGKFPVNLVLQSRDAALSGSNKAGSGTWEIANLPFDPTTGIHEYRFDFLRDRVYFLADGQVIGQMTGQAIPAVSGHAVLSHWSNGDDAWSAGPPSRDAVLTVAYAKLYFNSTTSGQTSSCTSKTSKAVCDIPASPQGEVTYFSL